MLGMTGDHAEACTCIQKKEHVESSSTSFRIGFLGDGLATLAVSASSETEAYERDAGTWDRDLYSSPLGLKDKRPTVKDGNIHVVNRDASTNMHQKVVRHH